MNTCRPSWKSSGATTSHPEVPSLWCQQYDIHPRNWYLVIYRILAGHILKFNSFTTPTKGPRVHYPAQAMSITVPTNSDFEPTAWFSRHFVRLICHSRSFKSHNLKFLILTNIDITDAQTREMGDTILTHKFKQQTIAHPTAHLPPHRGSTWWNSAMLG
jgi:hypothetical protein